MLSFKIQSCLGTMAQYIHLVSNKACLCCLPSLCVPFKIFSVLWGEKEKMSYQGSSPHVSWTQEKSILSPYSFVIIKNKVECFRIKKYRKNFKLPVMSLPREPLSTSWYIYFQVLSYEYIQCRFFNIKRVSYDTSCFVYRLSLLICNIIHRQTNAQILSHQLVEFLFTVFNTCIVFHC